MNQATLYKLALAIWSLSDSTFIRVRVPFGPVVEVVGRNGERPNWRVGNVSLSVSDKLDKFFIADNRKYSAIFSPYYDLNLDPSEGQNFEFVEGILPSKVVVPIFRGIKEVFLIFSDQIWLKEFLPYPTIHLYITKPYIPLIPDFP